ncbi:MAG: hypothetical protein ABSE46_19945 [Terracidiphilus sp.]|jgi:hypothetical protein
MCEPSSQPDPRTRRLFAIGNLCLVAGLLLWSFVHPVNQVEKNWLHGLTGLLTGCSIVVNLYAFRLARRHNSSTVPS